MDLLLPVAHQQELVRAVARQLAQQPQPGQRDVLDLVDDDRRVRRFERSPQEFGAVHELSPGVTLALGLGP